MKKVTLILILSVICISTMPVMAQERTLISGKITHGGFGGPVLKVTQVLDETCLLVGGRGGWIINHTFVIGGGGYGTAGEMAPDAPENVSRRARNDLCLEMYYGGGMLEYIIMSDRVIHLSMNALIGAGDVNYIEDIWDENRRYDWADRYFIYDTDSFFVIEPGVDLELNVTKFFRINVGVSYRYIKGAELEELSDSDVSGVAATFTLKFGKF